MILTDQARSTKSVADLIIRHAFSFMRQSDIVRSRRSRDFLRANTRTTPPSLLSALGRSRCEARISPA